MHHRDVRRGCTVLSSLTQRRGFCDDEVYIDEEAVLSLESRFLCAETQDKMNHSWKGELSKAEVSVVHLIVRSSSRGSVHRRGRLLSSRAIDSALSTIIQLSFLESQCFRNLGRVGIRIQLIKSAFIASFSP